LNIILSDAWVGCPWGKHRVWTGRCLGIRDATRGNRHHFPYKSNEQEQIIFQMDSFLNILEIM